MSKEDIIYLNRFYKKDFTKLDKLWEEFWGKNPEYIYHYTSITALSSILYTESFFLTSCEFLNDSKEIIYLKQIIDHVFEKEKKLHPH